MSDLHFICTVIIVNKMRPLMEVLKINRAHLAQGLRLPLRSQMMRLRLHNFAGYIFSWSPGLWSRHKYATALAPAPELSSIAKQLRLRSPRSYDAYELDQNWAALGTRAKLGTRALMSGTRAKFRKYDPCAFQMRKFINSSHSIIWRRLVFISSFFHNSLFISHVFGDKYANQDTLSSSNVSKKAKLNTSIIGQLVTSLNDHRSLQTALSFQKSSFRE